MPLISVVQPGAFDDDRYGVLFPMHDGSGTISILVSRHALEDVGTSAHVDGDLERFNEYRKQFEQIASDKYDGGSSSEMEPCASGAGICLERDTELCGCLTFRSNGAY